MQGRILCFFLPQRNAVSNQNEWIRLNNITQKTQLPRVELDIGTQSECIMEIPYTSPASCLNLRTGIGNLGSVFFQMYSPLEVGSGGSNSCDYTIWVSFKDVELNTPAPSTLVFGTQMDFSGAIVHKAQPTGSIKQKKVMESERRRTGWLSDTLNKASNVVALGSELLSPVAPALSSLAAPTEWALSAASGLASAFGWSKPPLNNDTTIVKFGSAPFMLNSDGCDTAIAHSNQSTNQLRVLPGFGNSDIDEMSLQSLVSRPAFYKSFDMSVNDAVDTSLFNMSLTPSMYAYETTLDPLISGQVTKGGTTVAYRTYLPIAYFTRFFKYYRGSIKITLKFVKTEFHSGRVSVVYTPGPGIVNTNANTTFVYRDILDLRHSSEFSFVAPYVSTTPYRPTTNEQVSQPNGASYGDIDIRVVNELKAPASVPSTIRCLVEVSAADDFELACPVPFIGANQLGGYEFNARVFTTQMDSVSDIVGAVSKFIGSSKIVNPNNMAPAEYCIGEHITSVKQLLTRFSRTSIPVAETNTTTRYLDPWAIGTYGRNDANTGFYETGLADDYYALIASCFAYSRGSIRIGVTNSVPSTRINTFIGDVYNSTTSIGGSPTNYTRRPCQLAAVHNGTQNNNFTEVRMPMYCPTPYYYNQFYYRESPITTPLFYPRSNFQMSQDNNSVPGFYRAVGDDFQLGMFLCCPPILVDTSYP